MIRPPPTKPISIRLRAVRLGKPNGRAVVFRIHQGDTTTMPGTLASAAKHLAAVGAAPTPAAPAELIADKGYHSRDVLKALDDGPWKSRISEPYRDEFSRWHGDDEAPGRSTTIERGCSPAWHGKR